MIYLSKPIAGRPRYIAERLLHHRALVWSMTPTGRIADLRQSAASAVITIAGLLATLNTAAAAQTHEIKSCAERDLGIGVLVTPVAKNVKSFYNNRVQIYNIDTIEPASAAAGIAIVLPDSDSPVGGTQCLAITNFGEIDIKTAQSTYDPIKGLLIRIPTKVYDLGTGEPKQGPMLTLSISLRNASVSATLREQK